MPKLGVNVDHIATLRQARLEYEPDPVEAALMCEKAGCNSIVAHLREDRRHINDRDIRRLKKTIKTHLNLEMSINRDIVEVAKDIIPYQATLVPERRKELTTEGGLDVVKFGNSISKVIDVLSNKGIKVSLFIDPDTRQIDAARKIEAQIIEIHTGLYSLAKAKKQIDREFLKIKDAVEYALSIGFEVNAGHGLNYTNAGRIAGIKGINELNIGHSIISRAVFTGIYKAVRDMKDIVR